MGERGKFLIKESKKKKEKEKERKKNERQKNVFSLNNT